RVRNVTGVQTCALPISTGKTVPAGTSGGITLLGTGASAVGALCLGLAACVVAALPFFGLPSIISTHLPTLLAAGLIGGITGSLRSEERRVGKERRTGGG